MAPQEKPISWKIVENDKDDCMTGCDGLHNDVDIKIVIIYKNIKNTENILNFGTFWSIVFMQCDFGGEYRLF